LILATGALLVGGFAYVVVGFGMDLLFTWVAENDPSAANDPELALISSFMAPLCYVLAAVSVALAVPLHMGKKWGWIAALVMLGTYAASAFLPIGAVGLWGLLDKPTREAFGI
jgi:hypothetical protein